MSGNICITTRPPFRSMYSVFSGSVVGWEDAVSLIISRHVRVAIAAPATRMRRYIGALLGKSAWSLGYLIRPSAADALQHPLQRQRRHERGDVAAQHGHLLHEARGNELM